jgi:hypothetical protein
MYVRLKGISIDTTELPLRKPISPPPFSKSENGGGQGWGSFPVFVIQFIDRSIQKRLTSGMVELMAF